MTAVREDERVFISEMLFFVQNKLSSTPKNIIIESCVKFYSVDEISKEKDKFEKAFCVRLSKRYNNEDFGAKMLADMIEKMLTIDGAGDAAPKFVAADLSRVPNAATGTDSFVSLDMLLASIHDMKCSIKSLQSVMVTREHLEKSLSSLSSATSSTSIDTSAAETIVKQPACPPPSAPSN